MKDERNAGILGREDKKPWTFKCRRRGKKRRKGQKDKNAGGCIRIGLGRLQSWQRGCPKDGEILMKKEKKLTCQVYPAG